MSATAGVLLLVAAFAIVIGVTLQVLQYRRGQHIISRGQLASRLLTGALLLVIIGMIFFGVLYQWPNPVQALIFWSVLLILAVAVIFLALRDLGQVEKEKHLRQAELYRAIQEIQDMHEESSKGKPPPERNQ